MVNLPLSPQYFPHEFKNVYDVLSASTKTTAVEPSSLCMRFFVLLRSSYVRHLCLVFSLPNRINHAIVHLLNKMCKYKNDMIFVMKIGQFHFLVQLDNSIYNEVKFWLIYLEHFRFYIQIY